MALRSWSLKTPGKQFLGLRRAAGAVPENQYQAGFRPSPVFCCGFDRLGPRDRFLPLSCPSNSWVCRSARLNILSVVGSSSGPVTEGFSPFSLVLGFWATFSLPAARWSVCNGISETCFSTCGLGCASVMCREVLDGLFPTLDLPGWATDPS